MQFTFQVFCPMAVGGENRFAIKIDKRANFCGGMSVWQEDRIDAAEFDCRLVEIERHPARKPYRWFLTRQARSSIRRSISRNASSPSNFTTSWATTSCDERRRRFRKSIVLNNLNFDLLQNESLAFGL